jgi:hypothetical protein
VLTEGPWYALLMTNSLPKLVSYAIGPVLIWDKLKFAMTVVPLSVIIEIVLLAVSVYISPFTEL